MDKKIFIVAKREYLERVRSRWFIAITLLVPVIMAGAVMFPTYVASRTSASRDLRHIIILDATGAQLGTRISTVMLADSSLGASSDSLRPTVLTVDAATLPAKEKLAATSVMRTGGPVGLLVLDDSTLAGNVATYEGRNASSIGDMDKLRQVVRQSVMMLRLEREGMRKDVVDAVAKSTLRLNTERLTERGRGGSGSTGLFAGIVVAVMLFMLIVFHGQNIMRGVLEEKSTRVAEVVISSIKPESLLTGKVLGVGAVGLTQQIAWMGIGLYLVLFFVPVVTKNMHVMGGAAAASPSLQSALGGLSPGILVVATAYFLIGFVFYATLYAAAGSMVNSEQEAQQAAMPVMVLLMSTWLMVNPVMIDPTGKAAVILSWLPWSSPIIMPMRMGLTTVAPLTVAGSMLVAVAGCWFAVWFSGRIYRVGMLMYGKRPSFREVAKWIRYA